MTAESPSGPEGAGEEGGDSVALLRFRALYEAHRAVGDVEPLPAYQARFPGHDDAIAAEYARLASERVLVRAPSSMEAVAARLARPEGGRYRTMETLGRGGMGLVLRVRDEDLGRDLAMKVIPGEEGRVRASGRGDADRTLAAPGPFLRRFLLEAQVTAQLDHPGVVPVHELAADDDGYAYFTMKLVHGISLADAIRLVRIGHGGWTLSKAVQMVIRVCETVGFAHTRGVIHRDLKPANVMVGDYGQVYVVDWGLAKVLPREGRPAADPISLGEPPAGRAPAPPAPDDPSPAEPTSPGTMAGSVLGTPQYMPPEQAQGRVDALDERSDVYSLGAILYEVLGGVPPYSVPGEPRHALEVLGDVLAGPPRPIAELARDVPAELHAVTERAMARDPAARYASAMDLADDLHRFLDGRVVRAHRGGPLVELRKWVARNRTVAALLALATAGAFWGAAAFALRERDSAHALAEERNEAMGARDAARAASRRADGLRLAASSLLVMEEDPTLALQLAIEAGTAAPGLDSSIALHRALAGVREVRRFNGHDMYVESATFSPDGTRILTGDAEGYVRVWDAATGSVLHGIDDHGARLTRCAWSPDGGRFLTAGTDGTVRVYDAASGAALAVLDHAGAHVRDAGFDATGRRVATAAEDGLARVFDAASGTERVRFAGHGSAVRSVEFSPDGALVLTAGGDQRARAWRATDGSEVFSAPLSDGPDRSPPVLRAGSRWHVLDSARFVAGGTRIVTDSTNDEVRLLDARDGRLLRVLAARGEAPAPPREVLSGPRLLATSRDGSIAAVRLVSPRGDGGWIQRVAILDTGGVRPPLPVDPDAGADWAALSPDGSRLVVSGTQPWTTLVDVRTGATFARLLGHDYSPLCGEFSPDGALVLTGSADMSAMLWDGTVRTRLPPPVMGSDGRPAPTLAVDHSGTRALRRTEAAGDRTVPLEVVDLRTGAPLARLEDPGFPVQDAAFDAAAARVALSGESAFRTWEPATGALSPVRRDVRECAGHFSPDGTRVALRGKNVLVIVDAATLEPVSGEGVREHPGILNFNWSADGSRGIAAEGGLFTLSIVDGADGRVLRRLEGHVGYAMHGAFSPDGRLVATTGVDRSVRLFSPEDGRMLEDSMLLAMEGHILDFHPDGRSLLACGKRLLHVLTVPDLRAAAKIDAPRDSNFRRARFSPDGRTMVVQHQDGSVSLFPTDPLDAARARMPRGLDGGDRIRFAIGTPDEHRRVQRARMLREGRLIDLMTMGSGAVRLGDEDYAREAAATMLLRRPKRHEGHVLTAMIEAARAEKAAPGPERDAARSAALAAVEAAVAKGWAPRGGLDAVPWLAPLRGTESDTNLFPRPPR